MGKGKKRKISDDYDKNVDEENSNAVVEIETSPYNKTLAFSNIGGLLDIKKELLLTVMNDFVNAPKTIDRKTTTGVLFYGPPGTGKSFMSMCLVAELNRAMKKGVSLYSLNGELKNKYFGESEKLIKNIFAKARETAPSVILLDEMESLGTSREASREEASASIVSQLLVETQNLKCIQEKVLVIGITNLLDKIDPALIRSGRIDKHFQFLLPNEKGRFELLEIMTENWSTNEKPSKALLLELARATDGFTGADIEKLSETVVYRAQSRILSDDTCDINDVQTCLTKLKSKKWKVTPEDWKAEAKTIKPILNSFGSCLYNPVSNLPLPQQISSFLFKKIEKQLAASLPKQISNGKIIKNIIIRGSEILRDDLNDTVLPTMISNLHLMDEFILYGINWESLASGRSTNGEIMLEVLQQSIRCPKPAVAVLTNLDILWSGLTLEQRITLKSMIGKANRNQVLVLATTCLPLKDLLLDIFDEKVASSVEIKEFDSKDVGDCFEDMFHSSLIELKDLKFGKGLSISEANEQMKEIFDRLVKMATKMKIKNILTLKLEIEGAIRSSASDAEDFLQSFENILGDHEE